ncbi:zinc finger and BTB domain-containing protein 8A.1-B-like [Wyeomyia smithii]|uniref:zinc finger and BTB domain-containing protein 8A.1-B-like n=1 Tax=Wyeomyia smithii TaxID=174621 RepID=UPI002467E5F5|nr:zinc finger and BTB domain-containing protein 8A.1-B-like [Wyeomyia smithii]
MNNSVCDVPNNNPGTYCRLCFSQTKVVPIFPLGSNHNQKLINQVYQWTGVQINYQEDFTCAICWKCTVYLEEFQRFCDRCRKNDWIVKQKRTDQIRQGQKSENSQENSGNQMDDRRFGYMYPLMQPALGYEFRLPNETRDRPGPEHPRTLTRVFHEAIQPPVSHVTKSESRIDIDTEFKHVLPVERLPEELVNMLDLPASSSKRPATKTESAGSGNSTGDVKPPKQRSSQYQKIVESGGVQCPICKKPYTTDKNLKKHLRLHTLSLPFTCNDCGAKFSERRDFQKHQERYHGPNATASVSEIFHCEFCSRVFTRQRDMTKHLRLFHEPPEDAKLGNVNL